MSICESCGARISDDYPYCPWCGEEQPGEKLLPESAGSKQSSTKQSSTKQTSGKQSTAKQSGYVPPSNNQKAAGSQKAAGDQQEVSSKDSTSFGWVVLGFLLPPIGLALCLAWKNTRPQTTTRLLAGALVMTIIYLFSWISGRALRSWLVSAGVDLFAGLLG